MFLSKKSHRGFTLIELLIVIAIIAILTGLLFSNFSGARERARDTRRKSDLKQMQTALQLYNNDFNTFPLAGNGATIAGCGASGTSTCAWGSSFSAGSPTAVYMGALPQDPVNSGSFVYSYAPDATVDYKLTAKLENASDPDIQTSQTRCGVATPVAGVFMVCNQ